MDRFERLYPEHRVRVATCVLTVLLGAACGPFQVSGQKPGPGAPPSAPSFSLPDAAASPAPPPSGPAGACAGEVHQAEVVPVDLMLLMDTSASMGSSAGGQSMWERAQLALSGFISDPASAGLGMGLQFFPRTIERPCTTDADCVDMGAVCHRRDACPGPDPLAAGARCDPAGTQAPPTCESGAMCVPTGACSVSGALCTNAGEACPAGAGDCVALPRSCIKAMNTGVCDPATYETPAVAIGELPGMQGPLLTAIHGRYIDGGTPMSPAVQGAFAHLRAHLAAHPSHKGVLLLVTDGTPSVCGEIGDVAAHMAVARLTSPSISSYVIGLFFKSARLMLQPKFDQLASAGGSDKAILLEPGTDLTGQLQAALTRIRGHLSCEYRIPIPANGGRIDPGKVNVHYTGEGVSEDIPYVQSADRCDPTRGGWYYDLPPGLGAPTRILTCETTCRRFQSSDTGKVDLVFGCGTVGID